MNRREQRRARELEVAAAREQLIRAEHELEQAEAAAEEGSAHGARAYGEAVRVRIEKSIEVDRLRLLVDLRPPRW